MATTKLTELSRRRRVVYDRETGRVLGTHRHYVLGEAGKGAETVEIDSLGLFQEDQAVLGRVSDKDADRLGVLETSIPDRPSVRGYRVRKEKDELEALPRLRLQVDRTELEGDGKDSVEIRIEAITDDAHVDRSFAGRVQVRTSRGKLSSRGGVVELKEGQARIQLTSVAETVDEVVVRVRALDEPAEGDSVSLAFM